MLCISVYASIVIFLLPLRIVLSLFSRLSVFFWARLGTSLVRRRGRCNDHGISNRIFYPFVVLLFLRWIFTVSVGVGRHADFRY